MNITKGHCPAIALIFTALTLCLTLGAAAAPIPHGPEIVSGLIDRALHNPEILEAADITDDQVAALTELTQATQRTLITQRAQIEIARLDLQSLWQADEPDADAIHEAIDQLNALETTVQHTMADARIRSMEILSPEQRQALRGFARERIQERMENRLGDGPQRDRMGQAGDRQGQRPFAEHRGMGDRAGFGGRQGGQFAGFRGAPALDDAPAPE